MANKTFFKGFRFGFSMLSPGQIHALKTGTKVDGTEASRPYMRSIEKTVRLKIYDAANGLKQVYDEFPELRSLVNDSLSWHSQGVAKEVTSPPVPSKKKPAVDTSKWPTAEELEAAPPVVIDEETKTKIFRDLGLNQ